MNGRAILRFALSAAGARLTYAVLTRRPPGDAKTWTRINHRGEPLTLLEGPAVAVAAAAAALVVPGLDGATRSALALAGSAAGAVGCYDDLAGNGDRRGFRGHLGALAKGELTTGTVKIAGIGAAGLLAGVILAERQGAGSAAGRAADTVINAGLVAGSANLMNLFDLRPGRATKVALLASAALAASGPRAQAAAAAPAGAALALLPEDLGEKAMLGDTGANALGAMLGAAAAAGLPRPARLAVLTVVAGLMAASEKVSFTKVIARTRPLNWLDMLGRRPADVAVTAEPGGWPEGGTPLAVGDEPARAAASHPQ
jgi:UDP-GlcNAc:undecaprenyl-phosphate GlcNAc-1-phosphate transferase